MKKNKKKQIGQLLIEKNLITQEQLEKALEVQLQEGGLVGQILVKLKYVTSEQIEESIYEQTHTAQKLENILLDIGIITQEQLDKALEMQTKKGGSLFQLIIEMGYLSEEDLVSTMVTQYGFPYLQLENYEIETELVKIISKDIAQKYNLIPIDKIGNILTVAMADPLNSAAKEEIKQITGLDVETFISTFSDINNAIAQYYEPK
ncbi:MAG: hypothetical protein ABII88_10035 [Candidatus Omnitrophota bacterium]